MIRAIVLASLLFSAPTQAEVLRGHGFVWLWDYEDFITPATDPHTGEPTEEPPTLEQHLKYCVREKEKANEALQALWKLQAIGVSVYLPRQHYALALGEAYARQRFFSGCEWKVNSEIGQAQTEAKK
jgi:hypothetical protein